jgi:hypothetical protein
LVAIDPDQEVFRFWPRLLTVPYGAMPARATAIREVLHGCVSRVTDMSISSVCSHRSAEMMQPASSKVRPLSLHLYELSVFVERGRAGATCSATIYFNSLYRSRTTSYRRRPRPVAIGQIADAHLFHPPAPVAGPWIPASARRASPASCSRAFIHPGVECQRLRRPEHAALPAFVADVTPSTTHCGICL